MAEPDEARAFAATVYRALGLVQGEERRQFFRAVEAALREAAGREERPGTRQALLMLAGKGGARR